MTDITFPKERGRHGCLLPAEPICPGCHLSEAGKEHRGYSANITETAEETEAWIADGAYASEELAADKNIGLLTAGLRGRKPREILTQFKLFR